MHPAREAHLLAGSDLGFNVKLGSGIFAHEDDGETRADAFTSQALDFLAEFREDLIADFCAVEDACGHSWLAFSAEGEAARPMVAQGYRQAVRQGPI